MIRNYLLFCLFLATSGRLAAQPGSLDLTFGQGGKILTNVDETRNDASSVLIQPDGRIVVVGSSMPVEYAGLGGYFTLVRYNLDGSVDNDFGLNGNVTTVINGEDDIAFSGALQADGKIIAAGYTLTGTNYDFVMVRYNPDGTRDPTFGMDGIIITDFNGGNDIVNQVLIEPDGDIILIGYTGDDEFDEIDMAFAKYKPDGTPDHTFGGDGLVIVPASDPKLWDIAYAVAVQADGRLVIVGSSEIYNPVTTEVKEEIIVLRLDGNGALDNTFGNSGVVELEIGQHRDVATSIVINSEGKIIVLAESRTNSGYSDLVIVRFTSFGALDTTFGTNGMTVVSFDNTDDKGYSLVLQPDQKILAGGYTARSNGSKVDYALARFDSNGFLDNTFGNGGKVTVDFQGSFDYGAAIVLQQNGNIVMAGSSNAQNDFDFGLVRFENDVALPVKLIRFDATRLEKQVHLKWQTAEELNSDYFEIQRSPDGIKWAVVGTITAAKTSVTAKEYSFADANPEPGQNYYRLKMVDQDETYAFSNIEVVRFSPAIEKNEAFVYPNPATNKLYLSLGKGQVPQRVQVYQLNGTLAFQSESGSPEVNLPNLKAGEYFLVLHMADGSAHSQMIAIGR